MHQALTLFRSHRGPLRTFFRKFCVAWERPKVPAIRAPVLHQKSLFVSAGIPSLRAAIASSRRRRWPTDATPSSRKSSAVSRRKNLPVDVVGAEYRLVLFE